MHADNFDLLNRLAEQNSPDDLLTRLADILREEQDYHHLFDALLLKRKFELGLPVVRPASLEDVPADLRRSVEETYIASAREVGRLFIAKGDLPAAWMYLQVIREPQELRAAIEELPLEDDADEKTEQLIRLALFEQVHPAKGVEMMLRAHGTCSTITALDQVMSALTPESRSDCAKIMVRHLYQELVASVRRHVQERLPMVSPGESLRELVSGRDWIFEGGGYHVDVSHLNAVVRFARSIMGPADELDLALQLCDYGSRLDDPLQYAGDPPFEEFYPAHREFFSVLLDRNRDSALGYFRRQMDEEPDESDRAMLAYVLVDLLMRVDRRDEAVDVAAAHLANLGSDAGFSLAELCMQTERFDTWQEVTRKQGDLVGYAAALVAARARH